jgi:hypothetical protein
MSGIAGQFVHAIQHSTMNGHQPTGRPKTSAVDTLNCSILLKYCDVLITSVFILSFGGLEGTTPTPSAVGHDVQQLAGCNHMMILFCWLVECKTLDLVAIYYFRFKGALVMSLVFVV